MVFGCMLIAACSPITPTATPTELSPAAPSHTAGAYQQLVIDAPPVSGLIYGFGDGFLLHGPGATYVIKAPVH
jgi:hypothetical protein